MASKRNPWIRVSLLVALVAGLPAAADESWKAVLVEEDEPGESLIVHGVVFGPDGSTPRSGVRIYVYNTDVGGLYNPEGGNRVHRIHAELVTDSLGRYEFRTIKPGSYPGSRIPAHIHYVLNDDEAGEHRLELRFQDDPYLSDRRKREEEGRGRFGSIQRLERGEDGVLRCAFDIALE